MKTENLLAMVVDELGLLKAGIKALGAKEEGLKAELIVAASEGNKAFDGHLYRATVSFSNRSVTDWKAFTDLLLKAGVKPEVLNKAFAASTNVAEGLPVVRVTSL